MQVLGLWMLLMQVYVYACNAYLGALAECSPHFVGFSKDCLNLNPKG